MKDSTQSVLENAIAGRRDYIADLLREADDLISRAVALARAAREEEAIVADLLSDLGGL